MDSMPELFNALLQKEIKTISVLIVSENILATVTTHHHVIYSSGIMHLGFRAIASAYITNSLSITTIQNPATYIQMTSL